jgi:hypothetical protein
MSSSLGMESPCLFLVASGLRILLRFAGFCRGKLLIFFVINLVNGTHNLLVPGSNPGVPTSSRSVIRLFKPRTNSTVCCILWMYGNDYF